jgi:RHS repeat-associated protein
MKLGPNELNGLMDESYLYDKAGNITYLNRKGIIGWDYSSLPISSEIDKLYYQYSNDKELTSVIDTRPGNRGVRSGTTTYSYDARGNITSSSNPNGGYAITYNPLNLPYEITGDDGKEEIWYTAGAEKFKIISPLPQQMKHTRIYLRNLELELHEEEYRPVAYNHADGRLFFSHQSNGFNDPLGAQYQFHITDHLGNIMVQFEDRDYDGELGEDDGLPSSDILVRNHYYSFGMLQDNTWQGISPGGRAQLRYKYNGKELHKGSRLLDYGFRYYDPGIGRFTGVDPIADQYPHVTVYNYAENEPIGHIDLWGLQKEVPLQPDKNGVQVPTYTSGSTIYAGRDLQSQQTNNEPKQSQTEKVSGILKPNGGGSENNTSNKNESLGLSIFSLGTAGMKDMIDISAKIQNAEDPGTVFGSGGKFAKGMFNSLGYGTSLMGFSDNLTKTITGELNLVRGGTEMGVNIVSAIGLPGAAVGFGWEAGRWITQKQGYRENIRPRMQEFFGISPDEYMRCITCGGNGMIKIK